MEHGLSESPSREVLIEESVEGWKEFELEVMRDHADNVIIVCSIENFDAMGIHTGDSITVAPQMTLSDRQYQRMRNEAKAIIRKVGVDTGGSNIQFAVEPQTGRRVVIEMNPRVSRSSALASKATGFPIAKIAALLAVGYTLDEIPNDITKKTPACFEPSLDYVVVKIPRWTFEKFPLRRSTPDHPDEVRRRGDGASAAPSPRRSARRSGRSRSGATAWTTAGPSSRRRSCSRSSRSPPGSASSTSGGPSSPGLTVEQIAERTRIDPWFLDAVDRMIAEERALAGRRPEDLTREELRRAKRLGLSDRVARAGDGRRGGRGPGAAPGARARARLQDDRHVRGGVRGGDPLLLLDLRGRERVAAHRHGARSSSSAGGPNRIGQGIEFDYCCVHACYALSERGFETVMINCNPETVSTDYDTSDRLYFEPLTFEDVSAVLDNEKPDGILVQFGGQTPLKLARRSRRRATRSGAPRPSRSTWPRTAAGSASCSRELDLRAPEHAEARIAGGGARGRAAGSATRSWCGRPTCSAGARWPSSSTTRTSSATWRAPSRARRSIPC